MTRGSVLLVRHGETEWNRVNRYQGWCDSPLTERGIAQAEAVGLFLSTFAGTASAELVASPIGRARHTAEIIHARLGGNSPLRFDDRLREISLGSWEGLDRIEIAARVPGIFDGDGHYEWYFHMCGWPPPRKRSCCAWSSCRLQSCVRPVGAARMDCWP